MGFRVSGMPLMVYQPLLLTSSIFHLTSYINDACGFDAGVFTYQGVDHKELDLIVWCRLSGVVELILFDSTGDGEAIKA